MVIYNVHVTKEQVLQAMFKKATSPEIIKNYTSLLKALVGAFDTNMTTQEITSFIKYQIQAKPSGSLNSLY